MSFKKVFKLFRKYPKGENQEGKGCVFKGFAFDCDQKMADQAQREEMSDSGEHESVAWATTALTPWTCKRRPLADPADRSHGGMEFHKKVYVR